jgi:glutamate dehydrogenase/leucine dehydrogenase
MDTLKIDAGSATAVVQGYGNVGSITALQLARYGVKIIAISDVYGGIYNPKGIDLWKLDEHVARTKQVVGFAEAEPITNEQLLLTPCDILVPAALERQITEANAGKIKCRILAEAANGPTTPEADQILDQRPEVFVIPDVLCNAGGVIVSYFEWVQDLQSFFWTETEGGGQALQDDGSGLYANSEHEPQTQNLDADGGVERGDQTGAGGEADAGTVSIMTSDHQCWRHQSRPRLVRSSSSRPR